MCFVPYIESRKERFRACNCGEDHDIRIIRGIYHYAEDKHTIFCVGLLEHKGERHIWVSFITGEWPDTNEQDCYITSHIWSTSEGRIMKIENSESSPFESSDVFDCYPVTRDQILAVDGAKGWFIDTYLSLFKCDDEIGGYIQN